MRLQALVALGRRDANTRVAVNRDLHGGVVTQRLIESLYDVGVASRRIAFKVFTGFTHVYDLSKGKLGQNAGMPYSRHDGRGKSGDSARRC